MKKKIILDILTELDEQSKLKTDQELKIKLEEYQEILEIMIQGRLINGIEVVKVSGGKRVMKSSPKISMLGIEYLEQNKIS